MKSKSHFTFWFTLLCTLLLPRLGFSARFSNQFTEFELPPQWQCGLEGAEWICQSTDEGKRKEAIIVLAAKLAGTQDTLDQYLAYLKEPKVYTSLDGGSVKSEPKYAQNIKLGGEAWVDSLHLESEIPGFYTRYLATVQKDIGILITYSISKTKYSGYIDVFENMVKTLKVFRKTGGLNAAPQSSNLFQNIQMPTGVGTETVFPTELNASFHEEKPKKKPIENRDLIFILVAIGAAVGWILWKRRHQSEE